MAIRNTERPCSLIFAEYFDLGKYFRSPAFRQAILHVSSLPRILDFFYVTRSSIRKSLSLISLSQHAAGRHQGPRGYYYCRSTHHLCYTTQHHTTVLPCTVSPRSPSLHQQPFHGKHGSIRAAPLEYDPIRPRNLHLFGVYFRPLHVRHEIP